MWAVWQNGIEVFVCVLALRKLCVLIRIDCERPVDFRWPVSTSLRMVVLEAQVVLFRAWPGPSLPAWLPVN